MGDTFRYREAFYTPNRDRREVAREEDLPTHFARMGHLESGDCKPRKAYRLNAEEQEHICSMYQKRYEHCKYCSTDGLQRADRSERNQRPARAKNGSDVVGS